MEKRAQISVEYMMIIVLAMLIILPGIYLFRNYAFESNDKIASRRLAEITNQLLTKGDKIYYYGPPSRSVIALDMPPQIGNMYILNVPESNETYLIFDIFTSGGQKEITFDSDIPLRARDTIQCSNVSDECGGIAVCDCFPLRYFSEGRKNFMVEASEDCGAFASCIMISEVSNISLG